MKAQIVPILPGPLLLVEGEVKRRMDFPVKSRSQSLVVKRVIQAMSLMPSDSELGASPITETTMRTLVVSSLTGDASDVFDWILSLNHGEPQDLMTLLQMLREHYCGSLTFREQRNMIENLHQRSNEATINFLIRVSTSVSNLARDWKDELTEGELQALQYEVSLNGVKEEIRHVLDSEMAKRDGHLTPQQMYEAVKRYETYVAQNKRLDGKGVSTSAG